MHIHNHRWRFEQVLSVTDEPADENSIDLSAP